MTVCILNDSSANQQASQSWERLEEEEEVWSEGNEETKVNYHCSSHTQCEKFSLQCFLISLLISRLVEFDLWWNGEVASSNLHSSINKLYSEIIYDFFHESSSSRKSYFFLLLIKIVFFSFSREFNNTQLSYARHKNWIKSRLLWKSWWRLIVLIRKQFIKFEMMCWAV
jgi:hypothetical protein